MPDWRPFREAVQRGSRLAEQLAEIHRVEAWLEMPGDHAKVAIREEIANEDRARILSRALAVVGLRLQRDGGIPFGPQAQLRLQELVAVVDAGRASESEQQFVQLMIASLQLSQALVDTHPSLATPVSEAELARSRLRRAISEIFVQFDALPPAAIAPGSVTPAHLSELIKIISGYSQLEAATAPDNPALPELYWHMGSAARLLANGCILLGRNDHGRECYERAIEWFGKSGTASDCDDCRKRIEDLESRLKGDVDRQTGRSLTDLLASLTVTTDSLPRAMDLVDLVNTRLSVDDFLEAERYAEEAAASLVHAGSADPFPLGFDAVLDGWIKTAAASLSGTALMARLAQVTTSYCTILNARCSAALRQEPARADQASGYCAPATPWRCRSRRRPK